MAKRFTKLLLFDPPPKDRPADPPRHQPSEEALAAFGELESWLTGPRGRATTELAEDALAAVRKALVEGKHGYRHKAEDGLEALPWRNGVAAGDGVPTGHRAGAGESFHQAAEEVLRLLRQPGRSAAAGR